MIFWSWFDFGDWYLDMASACLLIILLQGYPSLSLWWLNTDLPYNNSSLSRLQTTSMGEPIKGYFVGRAVTQVLNSLATPFRKIRTLAREVALESFLQICPYIGANASPLLCLHAVLVHWLHCFGALLVISGWGYAKEMALFFIPTPNITLGILKIGILSKLLESIHESKRVNFNLQFRRCRYCA